MAARDDPITGLIAWPGFYAQLPVLLRDAVEAGRSLGLAIGDVDNLKAYVEGIRATDPASFGHMAGNALMARLGTRARNWLFEAGPEHACLATFGGDEIVLVAECADQSEFLSVVNDLRDSLGAALPCTVSFGAAFMTPDHIAEAVIGDEWWREFAVHAIGSVERTLFHYKHARREEPGTIAAGFVAPGTISRRAGASTGAVEA